MILMHKKAIAHGSLSYYSKQFNIIGQIEDNNILSFTVTTPPDNVVEIVEYDLEVNSYEDADNLLTELKNKYIGML